MDRRSHVASRFGARSFGVPQDDRLAVWTVDGIDMNLRYERLRGLTRRHFLKNCHSGLGALALTSLINGGNVAHAAPSPPADPMTPRMPPFAAKAKNVIFLHMA